MGFRLIRRTDVPRATQVRGVPRVRLMKQGQMHFNLPVTEALGETKTMAMVEYDEVASTLRYTACDMPPAGVDEDACFKISKARDVKTQKLMGSFVSSWAMLKWIGFQLNGETHKLKIVNLNPIQHSVTVLVPPALRGEAAPDTSHTSLQTNSATL